MQQNQHVPACKVYTLRVKKSKKNIGDRKVIKLEDPSHKSIKDTKKKGINFYEVMALLGIILIM